MFICVCRLNRHIEALTGEEIEKFKSLLFTAEIDVVMKMCLDELNEATEKARTSHERATTSEVATTMTLNNFTKILLKYFSVVKRRGGLENIFISSL